MPKQHITWFVLADGSRARFVARSSEGAGYEILAEYETPSAHVPTRDIVSDRPGRTRESAYPAHHAVEPRHDPHRMAKEAFTREVADRLNEASAQGAFDALVLYLDPRSLAILRGALDDATRRKVKAEFPKDLTKVPLAELPRHFADLG